MRLSWRGPVAVLAAVLWGLGSAWWTPRGPLTAGQALWSILISVVAGGVAGWVGRSRWAMLYAPIAFVVAVELARWSVPGPSVDALRLSPFGAVALVSGRGVHGLLSVLPIAVGAAYGAGIERRKKPTPSVATAVAAAVVVAVAVAVAIPAGTAPVSGSRPVADLASVDTGSGRLGVMIRGNDTSAPILLFVPGAPGGMEMGSVRRYLGGLEQHFVVATLDRRGGGKSYPALDPTSRVTVDGGVADIVAVTNYLRERFRQPKVHLLAHSGGSLLGALAAARHPDLFRAYIGTGQAVHLPATDRIFYDDVLAWARTTKNADVERQLTELGPPPYRDFYSYEPIVANLEGVYEYDRSRNAEKTATSFDAVNVEEYTLLERLHFVTGTMDTWHTLYPRMQAIDLRTDVRQLRVPAYFVQGANEMRGLAELFTPWYEALQAPTKRLVVFETAGHRPMFEQPDRFVDVMRQVTTETS